MWNFFLNNTRFSYLVMVALIGFGIFSIVSIPKESSPEVQVPVGIVTTVLPGAPAIDVETLVTNEIERGLAGTLENVKSITSSSREGVSSVTVEFEASADIDESIDDLKERVDAILPDLPEDANDPVVTEVDFVDQPVLILAISGDRTDDEFTDLADEVESELESINGVSRVELTGVRDREINVVVDEQSLLQFGLSINDVVNGIRSANNTFPIGQIVTDNISYNIVFDGDIEDPETIREIPIASRGGQPVLVSDVANIEVGLTAPTTLSRLSIDSQPSVSSIGVNVYKQRGGDITVLTAEVLERVEELQATGEILEGLTTYTVQDAGEQIGDDLFQLTRSGLQTVVLVVLLLVVFIGWREGLIAGTAIPLSFMIGFIGLFLSGNTINFISLFALILGIGVLVDSGIVMVEGINKRMKDNPNIDKFEAARLTVQEFSSPLTSGTLTTVSMFVGLFVVSGVTGQFIAGIPFTLVFVLFASLLVALGFLPLLAATNLHRRNANKFEEMQVAYSRKLENWYRGVLSTILHRPRYKIVFLSLLIVGFISAIALVPLGFVKVVFFEESDIEFVFVDLELPVGTVKETTDIAMRRMEDVLYKHDNMIEAFSVTVGGGNAFTGGGQNERIASVFVTLRDDRPITSGEFMDVLRDDFSTLSDLDITVSQPNNGPPTGSPIGVRVLGDDLDVITNTALEISRLLEDVPGTTNVSASTNNNSTELVLTLDRQKTSAVGLSPQIVSQTLRSAVFGSDATSITTLSDDIDVVVKLNYTNEDTIDPARSNWTDIDSVLNTEIVTPSGDRLLLSSLVDVSLRESSTVINHDDQRRVVSVASDITPEGNVREINSALREKIDNELNLPESVEIEFGGETEESDQAFGELFLALVVGIVLMVGVLVLQFDSYRHTFYVLSILPFSLIGILYGLALIGSSLSFTSIMGFIALSGIIVNNSILLIDMMNQSRKKDPTKSIYDVVIDSAVSRLRPILLTSITTITGMIPLLYTDELWIPLAIAIMFGLAFSVLITLILIPVIYSKWPGTVRS